MEFDPDEDAILPILPVIPAVTIAEKQNNILTSCCKAPFLQVTLSDQPNATTRTRMTDKKREEWQGIRDKQHRESKKPERREAGRDK